MNSFSPARRCWRIERFKVFVAAMGASSYTFACATADQSMRSWMGAMARALTRSEEHTSELQSL